MDGLMEFFNGLTSGSEEPTEEALDPSIGEPKVNKHIASIVKAHSTRMGIDYNDALKNSLRFATYVGLVENSGKTYGRNRPEEGKEQSSASGLYQFLTDDAKGQSAWQTGLNRTRKYTGKQDWISNSYEHGIDGVELTTRNQQTAVFLADMLEKKGSDKYMKGILEGNSDNWVGAYKELHYRGKATEASLKNANTVWKQMNLKVVF
jgi:hypothetical protein